MVMNTLTVGENIVNYIRGEIVSGGLKPGVKIKENDLAESLGVSNAPIREALRFLQNEYLVIIIPRKGAFVTEISIEDCHQIHEVRKIIECSSIELLKGKNITDIPCDTKSRSFIHRILPHYASKKMKNFVGLSDFHFNLVESTGNNWLSDLYKSIASAIVRYQTIYYDPELIGKFETEHNQILMLIQKRNYRDAKEAISHHIQSIFERVANQMIKKM